jgi:hypothetical protein
MGLLGLGLWLGTTAVGRGQQAPAEIPQPADQAGGAEAQAQQGMDVLTRGPIHEAYAEPVNSQPQPGKVLPKEPPAAIEEVPPDQKPAGENVQWIPGYWAWDDDRNDFLWVSGVWRIPPPDRTWVPGSWAQVEGGWQWTPGFWMTVQQGAEQQAEGDNLQYLPPPPAPPETGPSTPAPNDESVYIPGTWVYTQTRYAWRPGYWVDYRPGWVWIPAHYVWTPAGYVFIDGYWDFEFGRRGLIFAPIYFTQPLWQTAGWYYQPRYLVYDQFVLTSMFVRPGYYSYYFGDYFDPGYRRLGFIPWIDFRLGRYSYDPLWSYYRWAHRDDRAWITNIQNTYVGRFNNTVARPPRTLAQQNILVQNTNVTNITNVMAVSSLARADRSLVNLQPVPPQQRAQSRQLAQNLVRVAQQRSQAEIRLATSGQAPLRPSTRPQTVRLSVPHLSTGATATTRFTPPPSPASRTGAAGRVEEGRRAPGAPGVAPREPGRAPGNQPRSEPRAQPRAEPRPLPGTVEPRPQPRAEPRTEPRAQPRVEPRTEPRPQPRPPVERRSEPQAQPKPPAERRPEPQPRTEPRPEPRPTPQAQPRREEPRQPAPRPEPRTEPRPQPRPEPRTEPRPPARPEPRPEPRPDPNRRPPTD